MNSLSDPTATASPEKSVRSSPGDRPKSIGERRELQRIYVRGVELATSDTPRRDGAHLLLGECIRRDPGNLVYAEALLANLSEMRAQRGFAAWVRVKAARGLVCAGPKAYAPLRSVRMI